MSKNKKHLFSLVLTAVFTALTVVLSRFLSVNIWNMSIGFSFVSLMLCGMLLGAFWGGVCGALADFIGAILFPFGPYFPGFTVTAFLSGAVFGFVGKVAKEEKSRAKFILFTVFLFNFKLPNNTYPNTSKSWLIWWSVKDNVTLIPVKKKLMHLQCKIKTLGT